MNSSHNTCYFPCYCEHCSSVVQVNLLDREPACPKCNSTTSIPFDNPDLSRKPGRRVVESWSAKRVLGRDLNLTNGNYRCPKCSHLTLRFLNTGLNWD